MTKLSRMQVAVRQMAKSIKHIESKIDKLQQKKVALESEITGAEAEIVNIHKAIESFTGGLTLTQVFNPEATISEISEYAPIEVDDNAELEQINVTDMMAEAIHTEEEYPTAPEINYPTIKVSVE